MGLNPTGGTPQQRRARLPFFSVGVRLDQQQRTAGTEVAEAGSRVRVMLFRALEDES